MRRYLLHTADSSEAGGRRATAARLAPAVLRVDPGQRPCRTTRRRLRSFCAWRDEADRGFAPLDGGRLARGGCRITGPAGRRLGDRGGVTLGIAAGWRRRTAAARVSTVFAGAAHQLLDLLPEDVQRLVANHLPQADTYARVQLSKAFGGAREGSDQTAQLRLQTQLVDAVQRLFDGESLSMVGQCQHAGDLLGHLAPQYRTGLVDRAVALGSVFVGTQQPPAEAGGLVSYGLKVRIRVG
jgi:hypothetical protein